MEISPKKQEISAKKDCRRICFTCKFWSPVAEFEGICTNTEALSANIDVTEMTWSCSSWLSKYEMFNSEDFKD